MTVVALKRRVENAPDPPPPMTGPQLSEDPRARRVRIALALSVLVHAAIFSLFMFIPQQKPVVEKRPEVVILELAALGKPEAKEEKPPAPAPPPPEQKAPEPAPPVVEQKPPEPQPLPEIKPPPVPETPPAPTAEPLPPPPPKVSVKPEPKPELPPPPAPKAPEPQPEAPPVAAAPSPPETRERPAPPAAVPAPSPPAEKPGKGIESGVASGTSQAEMNRYITTLFTMIDAKKVYPPQSLQRREEGTVVVKLKVAADGTLVDVSSPTESPSRLVNASLEAVRKAAPFPPLPASLKQAEAEFEVPVVYKLQ